MKHRIAISLLLAAAALPAWATPRTVTLAVAHMTCSSCPYIVRKSLKRVPGVEKVAVSFPHKTAIVTYDDARTSVADLTNATTKAGYPSREVK